MKILIIGGSGFIGTRLVDELLKTGHDLAIFDKNPSPIFNHLVTIGDVRELNALNKALKGVDVVYNLAAEHRDDVTPTSLYYDVNETGMAGSWRGQALYCCILNSLCDKVMSAWHGNQDCII